MTGPSNVCPSLESPIFQHLKAGLHGFEHLRFIRLGHEMLAGDLALGGKHRLVADAATGKPDLDHPVALLREISLGRL